MPYDDEYLDAVDKMEKTINLFSDELKGIRTGRANPSLVENIKVIYHGSPTPLRQIAAIATPDPKMIIIKPYDPNIVMEIEKTVQKSDIGINPQNDGKVIRLIIPPLSEERRKQLSKYAKDCAEKAKVSLRNIRRDSIKIIEEREKKGELSEDEKFRFKDEMQKLLEDYEKKIDELLTKKQKDIMEV